MCVFHKTHHSFTLYLSILHLSLVPHRSTSWSSNQNIRAPLGVRAYPWIVSKKVCICLWVPTGKEGVYALYSVLTFYATKSLKNYGSCSTPDSSHQFDPNSSWVDFIEKVFIYVKERLFLKWYKGRKRFFLSHSVWSKSISNNFSEKVFAKIKSLWFLSFGCKKQFFPSASIRSEFILSWLLWEGNYICKRKNISEMI